MRIYIACGLTHVPRDRFEKYAQFIHDLASSLGADNEVKYALVNSDPQLASKPFDERAKLCYLWDRSMVEEAELVIAEASFPSTGLGIELQIASYRGTPIILCFGEWGDNKASPIEYENPDHSKHSLQIGEGYVSLMALGLPNILRAIRYLNPQDAVHQISEVAGMVERPSAG